MLFTNSMLALQVPIIQKAYDLITLLHGFNKRVAKAERYTLWQRAEKLGLTLLEQLIRTGYALQAERVNKLTDASITLDILKIIIRLCHDSKTIDRKAYLQLQKLLDEIGRMLGGWIKSLKATPA